ncbi:MAG: histidine phosphatase family protein [Chitinophagaceae bacterium]|nr:histidine phosphatase family protein [Chitinophagaceae bacterium]
MKLFIYATIFLSFFLTGCQSTNTIYIVRHAEKSTEPANDPHLSIEGKLRAEVLKFLLKDKNIKAIFSTERARNVETATPLSGLINIPIQYYGNDTLPAFLQRAVNLKKNSLIVGHSNTTVTMINSFDLPHTITNIADDDYDNMFIIKVKKGKAIKIYERVYGAVSPHVK